MLNRKNSRGASKVKVGAMLAIAVMGVTGLASRARATGLFIKGDNLTNLDLGTSWLGGVAPTSSSTDLVQFDNTLVGVSGYTFDLGSVNANWLGITYLDPASGITINSTNSLNLGASGIDMSGAPTGSSLTLLAPLFATANQTWNTGTSTTVVSTSSTITLASILTVGADTTSTMTLGSNVFNVLGAGSLVLNNPVFGDTASQFIVSSGKVNFNANNTFGTMTITGGNVGFNAAGGTVTGNLGGTVTGAVAYGPLSSQVMQWTGGTITNNRLTSTATMGGMTQVIMSGTVSFASNSSNNVNMGLASQTIALTGPTNLNLSSSLTLYGGLYLAGQIISDVGSDFVVTGNGLLVLRDVQRSNWNGNITIGGSVTDSGTLGRTNVNLWGPSYFNTGANDNRLDTIVANLSNQTLGTGTITINSGGELAFGGVTTANINYIDNPIVLAGGGIAKLETNVTLRGSITLAPNTNSNLSSRWNNKNFYVLSPIFGDASTTLTLFRNWEGTTTVGDSSTAIRLEPTDTTAYFYGTIAVYNLPANGTINGNRVAIGANMPGTAVTANGALTGFPTNGNSVVGTLTTWKYTTFDVGTTVGATSTNPIIFETGVTNSTMAQTYVIGGLSGAGSFLLNGLSLNTTTIGQVSGGSNANRTVALVTGYNNRNTTFFGSMTGTSSQSTVTKVGTGTMTMLGTVATNNTFAGMLSVQNGVLAINYTQALGNNAAVGLGDFSGTYNDANNNLPTTGTLTWIGTTSSVTITKVLSLGGDGVILSNGAGTMNWSSTASILFNGTGSRNLYLGATVAGLNTFGSKIVDNGVGSPTGVIINTGTWTLTNAATSASTYTGGTTINGGTLIVNVSGTQSSLGYGPVVVGPKGLLIGNNVTLGVPGANLYPSSNASGQTLTVVGSDNGGGTLTIGQSASSVATWNVPGLTLQDGAVLNFNVLSTGASDTINMMPFTAATTPRGVLTLGTASASTLVYLFDSTGLQITTNGSYNLITNIDVVAGLARAGSLPSGSLFATTNDTKSDLISFTLANDNGFGEFYLKDLGGGIANLVVNVTGLTVRAQWALGSGTWETAGNWTGGLPGAAQGDNAIFSGTSGGAVTVNTIRTLGQLALGSSSASYTLTAVGAGAQIVMNAGGTNSASIYSVAGNNVIGTNVQIVSPTTIQVNSGTLTIGSGNAGFLTNSGGGASLNIVGPGVVVLAQDNINGNNPFTAPITIDPTGTLQLGNNSSVGSVGSAITINGNLIISHGDSATLGSVFPDMSVLTGGGTLGVGSGIVTVNWGDGSTVPFTGTLAAINGATLTLDGNSQFNRALYVGANSVIDLGGQSTSLANLTGFGTITGSVGSLTFSSTGGSTFGGTIADQLGLNIQGPNTTGNNGTLTLNGTSGGNATASGLITINANGTISGGAIQVLNSQALNPHREIDILSLGIANGAGAPVLILGDGVNLANKIVLNNPSLTANYSFVSVNANSSATLSGNISNVFGQGPGGGDVSFATNASSSSFRMLTDASSTLTLANGSITNAQTDQTTFMTLLVMGGNFIAKNESINTSTSAIFIGYGAGNNLNFTLSGNSSIYNNFTSSGDAATSMFLAGRPGSPAASVNMVATDNAVITLVNGILDLNNSGTANSAVTLTLAGNSRLSLASFVKSSAGTTTLIMAGGTIIDNVGNTDSFIPATPGISVMLAPGGMKLDNGGNNIGISARFTHLPGAQDGGLTFIGVGTTDLNGSGSNYNGNTVINQGVVNTYADDALGTGSVLRLYNAGTLNMNGIQTLGGLDNSTGSTMGIGSATGKLNTNDFALTLNVARGGNYAFGGSVVAGAGRFVFTKTGAGTQTLTSYWNVTSDLTLGGGALVIGAANMNTTSSNWGEVLNVFGGAETDFIVLSSTTNSVTSTLNSSGRPITFEPGSVVNFVSGTSTRNQIVFPGQATAFMYSQLFFNGANFAFADTRNAPTGAAYLRAPIYNSDEGFTLGLVDVSHAKLTSPGTIPAGTTLQLITVLLSGNNSNITIPSDSMVLLGGDDPATGYTAIGAILKSGGGASVIGNGASASGGIKTTNSGSATSADGDLIVRVDGADTLTISAPILDNRSTNLVKSGAGILILSSSANTFMGDVYLDRGVLAIGNSLALQNNKIRFFSADSNLVFSGITAATVAGIGDGNSKNGYQNSNSLALVNAASANVALTLKWNGTTNFYSFTPFTGGGSLIKDGTGQITLLGTSSFTGGVTILNGILAADNIDDMFFNHGGAIDSVETSLGNGPVSLQGGTLVLSNPNLKIVTNGTNASTTVTMTASIVVPNDIRSTSGGNGVIDTTATANATFTGNLIAGTGTITRGGFGTGTMVLNGNNSNFNGTFVNALGNVTFANANAGSAAGIWVFNATSASNTITVQQSVQLGSLAGSLTTSGTNAYFATFVNSASNVSTITVGALGSNTTFDGAFASSNGNIALLKIGNSTLTLDGRSTYSGVIYNASGETNVNNASVSTQITQGVLIAASTSAFGASTAAIGLNNGSFSTNAVTLGISGVTIPNPIALITGTTVSSYVMGMSLAASGASGPITVNNYIPAGSTNTTFTYLHVGQVPTTTSGLTLSGAISGSGGLIVDYGPVVLSGVNNSFRGGVKVNNTGSVSGMLIVNNLGSTGTGTSSGTITVSPGAGIGGSGTVTSPVVIGTSSTAIASSLLGVTSTNIFAGVIAPGANGHGTGTLTIGNNLILSSNGANFSGYLAIDLTNPFGGAQDMLAFTGSASSLTLTKQIQIHFYQAGGTGANYALNGTYVVMSGFATLAAAQGGFSSLRPPVGEIPNNGTNTGTVTFSVVGAAAPYSIVATISNSAQSYGRWLTSGSGAWNNTSSTWAGGVPLGVGSIAEFPSNSVATINLANVSGTASSATISSMNILGTGYVIGNNVGTLTFAQVSGGQVPSINYGATGQSTLNPSVLVTNALAINFTNTSTNPSGTLTISSGTITATNGLAVQMKGTSTNSGFVSLTGISNISGSVTVGAATTLQVGPGAFSPISNNATSQGVTNAGQLAVNYAQSYSLDQNLIRGNGTLTNSGTGTMTLSNTTALAASQLRASGGGKIVIRRRQHPQQFQQHRRHVRHCRPQWPERPHRFGQRYARRYRRRCHPHPPRLRQRRRHRRQWCRRGHPHSHHQQRRRV